MFNPILLIPYIPCDYPSTLIAVVQPGCGDVIVHHPNLLQELTLSNALGQLRQGVVGGRQLPQPREPRLQTGAVVGTATELGRSWGKNHGKMVD